MKKISIIVLMALLLWSCNNGNDEKNELEVKAKEHATLIRNFHTIDSLYQVGVTDTTALLQFIKDAGDFANVYPEDDSAPELLVQAGILGMRLAQEDTNKIKRAEYAKNAIDLFDRVVKVYPDHESVKYCYWWKGIIYNEILKMYPSAENEYREFLHKFPNDSLATTVKFSLENIGKTAPEIMAEIENNGNEEK